MKVRHSQEVKSKVLELGGLGKTYAEIRAIYPIPKSTLSYWFKKAGRVPDYTNQAEHLKRAREKGLETIRRNKQIRLAEAVTRAETNMENFSFENMSTVKALLAMLYCSEYLSRNLARYMLKNGVRVRNSERISRVSASSSMVIAASAGSCLHSELSLRIHSGPRS